MKRAGRSSKLTPEFLAKIARFGKVEHVLTTMVLLRLPLTAEAWADLKYDRPLDELTAEELAEMPEALIEDYED
ncbi:MAG: hypothetical protein WCN98_02665 [Verrucomicrobiaceae bacterium]